MCINIYIAKLRPRVSAYLSGIKRLSLEKQEYNLKGGFIASLSMGIHNQGLR